MGAPVRRLDANHDRTFGHSLRDFLTGTDANKQRLKTRLLFIKGEDPQDTEGGFPWFRLPTSDTRPIMGEPRDLRYSESVLKAYILETDGIEAILAFGSDFNPDTREWDVTVTVRDDQGSTFTVEETF